jgi:GNAT superfamily N-acetyltransferase
MAGQGDRDLLIGILDAAFQSDPVSGWLFPDPEYRRAVHPRLVAALTGLVLNEGWADVTEDGSACALWLSEPAREKGAHAEDDGPARLREAIDPDNERVELVGRLTGAAHPSDRAHLYLPLIGVLPDRQGKGLGTALLGPVLDRCDREGLPAYLEASNPGSRGLYERLGFTDREPLDLPDGPRVWPMWREPRG